jgi:hypothetical protein
MGLMVLGLIVCRLQPGIQSEKGPENQVEAL